MDPPRPTCHKRSYWSHMCDAEHLDDSGCSMDTHAPIECSHAIHQGTGKGIVRYVQMYSCIGKSRRYTSLSYHALYGHLMAQIASISLT